MRQCESRFDFVIQVPCLTSMPGSTSSVIRRSCMQAVQGSWRVYPSNGFGAPPERTCAVLLQQNSREVFGAYLKRLIQESALQSIDNRTSVLKCANTVVQIAPNQDSWCALPENLFRHDLVFDDKNRSFG